MKPKNEYIKKYSTMITYIMVLDNTVHMVTRNDDVNMIPYNAASRQVWYHSRSIGRP